MAKKEIPMANLITEVQELLDLVQKNLFELAKQRRDACVQIVRTWDEFIEALAQKKLIFAPWCDEEVNLQFLSILLYFSLSTSILRA